MTINKKEWELLGIAPTNSKEQVWQAYKRVRKQFLGDEEKLSELKRAKNIVLDEINPFAADQGAQDAMLDGVFDRHAPPRWTKRLAEAAHGPFLLFVVIVCLAISAFSCHMAGLSFEKLL